MSLTDRQEAPFDLAMRRRSDVMRDDLPNHETEQRGGSMRRISRAMLSLSAALFISSVTSAGAWAEDVQLLPPGLIEPSSKEIIPEGKFKKAPPWRIGLAFPGVGNTWIVQMLQEMKYEASLHKDIGEFTVLEADWKPAKQVADIEDLMARNVDLLIVAPIAFPVVAAQVDKAVAKGIPVVVFGASNGELNGTLEVFGGGGAFGRVGGEFLAKELGGKGSIWAVRGVAGVGEEVLRYEGFKKAIEKTDIKIVAEVFGDWNYAKSKQL
jgi:ribose transport system substrate-binding protein